MLCITPRDARTVLKNGIWYPNSIRKIDGYKKLIQSGKWHNIQNIEQYLWPANTLIFTETGVLWEGKHRIWSLALCNNEDTEGIYFLCILGWPDDKATKLSPSGSYFYNDEYGAGFGSGIRIKYTQEAVDMFIKNNWEETLLPDIPELSTIKRKRDKKQPVFDRWRPIILRNKKKGPSK